MELDKLHILFGSDLDSLVMSSSPVAESEFPVSYVQNPAKGKFTKISATSAVLTASVGVSDPALAAGGLVFGRHNLKNDGTVRLRLYDDIDQGGEVVFDSTALAVARIKPWGVMRPGLDPWGGSYEDDSNLPRIFRHWFDGVGYKSIQIDIDAPSNVDIQVGRILLGVPYVPEFNFSYGRKMEWVEPSIQSRTAASGLRTEKREAYRRYSLSLDWVNDQEEQRLTEYEVLAGKSQDCFVDLYPNGLGMVPIAQSAIMKRVNDISFTTVHADNNTQELIFEET